MRSPTPRRGFSMVELLVVIAIIALLIGILLPSLGAAMNAGRQTRCLANLRGLGHGIELYKNDFREVFPVARYMPEPWISSNPSPSFNEAMAQYVETTSEAYHCPGDKLVYDYEYTDDDGILRNSGSSYTYNASLGGDLLEESYFFKRLSFAPSEIPVLRDYDGGTFEARDGRRTSVEFFHDRRMFLFADSSAGGSKAN